MGVRGGARRVLLAGLGLFLLFALIGRFVEGMGAATCGCAADCWCQRPGLSFFPSMLTCCKVIFSPSSSIGAEPFLVPSQPATAINQLEAFINKVRAQLEPSDPALAAQLIADAQARKFDVIITDMKMPGGSGPCAAIPRPFRNMEMASS